MDALGRGWTFQFEGFRLDRNAGALFRRDDAGSFVPVAVGSRALDVLGVLVGRAGDLVSRDEFMAAVWPATAVEDINLNMQIAALRRVLDAGRVNGSCIQTVSGRGYRFAVPVARVYAMRPEGSARLSTASVSSTTSSTLPTVAPRLSIVVLPFANLSADREQQYFADGITDDLTTDLSRLAGLLVISRNTAFTYRNKPIDTKQIGHELGVRYALEGSVRRIGSQFRINAQLIDAESDTHLWAERFNGNTSDLFALQDEITRRIAITLGIELVRVEAARPTNNPDALDFILRGRAVGLEPRSRDSYARQISLFEHALRLDPRSAEAKSLLASSLSARLLNFGPSGHEGDLTRAGELTAEALAAAPRDPLAHYAKGEVLRVQGRIEEAISEYETVLASNPNRVAALAAIGRCKIFIGPIDEAIPAQELAIRLSPRDPEIGFWYFRIGQAHLFQSRVEQAIPWFEKARRVDPEIPFFHAYLASAYALHGDTEQANAELAEARRLDGAGNYSSIAREMLRQSLSQNRGTRPEIRALIEATFFAGLRKAGVPEN
jgi:TolB-like protein